MLNTTVLEADSWLQLNGGFVGGRALELSARWAGASNVLASSCVPPPPHLGLEYPLHHIHPPGGTAPHCAGDGASAAAPAAVSCELLRSLRFPASKLAVYLVAVAAADEEAAAVFLEAIEQQPARDSLAPVRAEQQHHSP